MADEPEEQDNILELTDEVEDQETETSEAAEAEAPEEFAIELEGEEAVEETPLQKHLREQIRLRDRELAEYRKQAQNKPQVGDEPTLEACEWDEDKFKTEWRNWNQRKQQADQQEQASAREAEVRNETFNRALGQYRAQAASMPVQDFETAETAVRTALPEVIQSAIITYASDPAKVVYALYKHPAKLASIADEPDPIKAILAIKDMERNLKVTTRKAPPPPMSENVQRGSAPISSMDRDKRLKKMEEDAERTGDRSKLIAYKSSLKK